MDVIKSCHSVYRNVWFLVKKSAFEKYRLVNVALELNWIIIQKTNLSPSADEFSKEFTRCTITFLIDFLLRYYQVELAEAS